jgi:formate-dependent phosphoribosylglycinamide formyltransferase (GAR transformylase)
MIRIGPRRAVQDPPASRSDNSSCGAPPQVRNNETLPEHKRFLLTLTDLGGHLNNAAGVFVTQCNCQGNKMIASNTSWIKRNAPLPESFGILALLSVLIAAPAFQMIRLLEPGLVLPAFSILLFSDAAIAAIVARINSENVTLWDIAGAFTMMGCAAAIFSEPDQVALFFEQPVEQRPDTPL